MRIYFYTNQETNNPEAKEIVSYLRRAEIEVISSLTVLSDKPLERVDVFVFQGEKLDAKASYLIALALAQNKKVLCLLPMPSKPDESLQMLIQNKNLAKNLSVESYASDNLREKLAKFLSSINKSTVRDLFDIKYTLRVSSRINDYLNWKARQEKIKKADWIRDKIQNIITDDEAYQDFLKNKFKVD